MTTLEDEITGQATYLQFNKKSKDINSLIREVEDERSQVLRSNKANFKSQHSHTSHELTTQELFYQTLIESSNNNGVNGGGGGTTGTTQ